jgi:hypothetical protein
MRRCRKRIAGWVMLGWLFAQVVTVAHACPSLAVPENNSFAASGGATVPLPGDCEAMAKKAGSTKNVCQSHCAGNEQLGSDVPAPSAALAPQPALVVRVCASYVQSSANAYGSPPRSVGPPPTLLFGRFLI